MLALRMALRELRGGLSGLRLLAVCLVLGVAALAGVGSLSDAITTGISDRGQLILGGDIEIAMTQRSATPAERAAFAKTGAVSEVLRLRGMAGKGADSTIAEVKAVDAAYPLYGNFAIQGGVPLAPGSVAVAPALADRLALKAGDTLTLGNRAFRVAGTIADEPDRAGEGLGFGPALILRLDDLAATGLLEPGSLYRANYRIRLPDGQATAPVIKTLESAFPDAGWRVQDRSDGAPGARRFIERLGQFLTLVGLTALVVAGVGVGNGVASYLDSKSNTIATLKSIGAESALIFRSYLFQIGLVALVSVVIGAAIGALVPWAVVQLAADAMPVPPVLRLYAAPLLSGAAYGMLIAVAFALWPLAQATAMPAAKLFRDAVEVRNVPVFSVIGIIAIAIVIIIALAVGQANDRLFALGFVGAATVLLGLLTALAAGIRALAARAPRPKTPLARLALGNLHRPGALTRQLVVALGLGLTLFATLSVIETNLSGQINKSLPDRAPSFFVLDIPSDRIDEFRAIVAKNAPGAALRTVPSLRGPVTAVNGVPVSSMKNIPDDAWILRGDRGLSYAAVLPADNKLVAGKWWPANYAGPPLISLDEAAATALGLKVGDTLTVSVLGVEIPAKIASLRAIDWGTLGFNFAILFAPGTLENAPHTWMATVAATPVHERALSAAITSAYPTASLVRVRDVLGQVGELLGQMSVAIRAAASVTVAAGIAVLIGALAASRRARTYDAVLLKVLGATRGQIIRATLIEYGALAAIVALLALALGSLAGWFVVVNVLKLSWAPSWPPVIATVLVGGLVTVLLGLAGSWRALAARPSEVLRTL
ncbi:ABC transporter permease [Polymorphobacter arshaanensis]|nr:FtsX-like permease family protein [Polymorphobacter arshaanensis]